MRLPLRQSWLSNAGSGLLLPLVIGSTLLLLMNWLFTLPLARHTQMDLISSKGYFIDAGAELNLEAARQREFASFNGALSVGNSAAATWMRLTVNVPADQPLALVFQPAFIQDVRLYAQDAEGHWQLHQGGNRYPFDGRPLPYLHYTVAIDPLLSGPTTFYVRIRSDSALSLVRAVPLQEAAAFDALIHFLVGNYVGLAIMMFLISIMAYLVTRDTLWAWTAICELGALVVTLLQTGLMQRYLLPDLMGGVASFVTLGNCVFLALFHAFLQRILILFHIPSFAILPYRLALPLLPVALLLILTDQGYLALAIINLLIFFTSFWGLLVALLSRHEDMLLNLAFRVSLTGLVCFMIYWIFPLLLKQPFDSFRSLYPAIPINLFSLLMLTLIMVRHTQLKMMDQRQLELRQQETALQLASTQALQAETQGLLSMIMHEVKSPLSFIRTAASNLEQEFMEAPGVVRRAKAIKFSVDNIDNVLERSLDVDDLERTAIQPLLRQQDIAPVIAAFCHEHAQRQRFRLLLPEQVMASVDADILLLILRNLLDNAVKYSPEASVIDVQLSASDAEFSLSVSNHSSHGLPDPEKIFTKYYRAPRAMSVSGMGLGLYWVGTVIRMLGGNIRYSNQDDLVVITLCLPR